MGASRAEKTDAAEGRTHHHHRHCRCHHCIIYKNSLKKRKEFSVATFSPKSMEEVYCFQLKNVSHEKL